MKNYKTKYN